MGTHMKVLNENFQVNTNSGLDIGACPIAPGQ